MTFKNIPTIFDKFKQRNRFLKNQKLNGFNLIKNKSDKMFKIQ